MQIGRNVEVLARVRRAGFLRAKDRIASVVVLRPETMHDEAPLWLALWRHICNRTELRPPRHIKQVEIKFARLALVLRAHRRKRHERRNKGRDHATKAAHVTQDTALAPTVS